MIQRLMPGGRGKSGLCSLKRNSSASYTEGWRGRRQMKIDKGGVSAWPGFRTVGKGMMKCGSRLAGGQ